MALPHFGELSATAQTGLILLLGVALWAASEFLFLKPVSDSNRLKTTRRDQLATEVAPLRPYVQKQRQLIAENQQLQLQLANLKQIVPEEKEVDNFVRLVEGASIAAAVQVRRFTAKPAAARDFYVEVPFEMELDGPYYPVLNFYDKLSKLPRIINVSDLKLGGIEAGKSVLGKAYTYRPNETVKGICTITTFFSREEEVPAAGEPAQPSRPAPRR